MSFFVNLRADLRGASCNAFYFAQEHTAIKNPSQAAPGTGLEVLRLLPIHAGGCSFLIINPIRPPKYPKGM